VLPGLLKAKVEASIAGLFIFYIEHRSREHLWSCHRYSKWQAMAGALVKGSSFPKTYATYLNYTLILAYLFHLH
jgi:hypothetical protein